MTALPWPDPATWPFSPAYAPLPDGRMHYVDVGTGPAVVLVHGTPTWGYEWRHLIPGLAATHRVLVPDHLGFGRSARPLHADYSPEAHARRFAAWMDHTLPDGPVTLVVHDFGGPIALDWALRHATRLHRLVIVNSWMWSFADDPVMWKRAAMVDGRLGRLLYRYANASLTLLMPSAYGDRRRLTPAVHAQYRRPFPDADSRELVLFALARSLRGSSVFFDTLWQQRSVLDAVPMSILWGMRDTAFGPAILQRWVDTFPHATVTRFADAGHWPHEEAPDAFGTALAQLLPAR